MKLFKDTSIPAYKQRIAYLRTTFKTIEHEKLIERQPEVHYAKHIISHLRNQVDTAELALVQRKMFHGQIRCVLRCRDVLDCRLNGMITRINDAHRHLKAGIEEREKDGEKQRERVPTKTEGKSIYKASVVLEESGEDDSESDDNFEDAVETLGGA